MVKRSTEDGPDCQYLGESSDSALQEETETSKSMCQHVGKSVSIADIKKQLKAGRRIGICDKKVPTPCTIKADKKEDAPSRAGLPDGVWMCLQCGHQGCAGHATQHFNTPRSDSHALAVDTADWAVWCFTCSEEVSLKSNKKLHEAVQFVRKKQGTLRPAASSGNDEPAAAKISKGTAAKDKASLDKECDSLPKVKGLINLGNTCYLNSVLQCVSQCHYLTHYLDINSRSGRRVSLVDDGGKTIELVLPEGGPLTAALCDFLKQMHTVGSSATISPGDLLRKIAQKAPQFVGYDQQDAHELLRALMEQVRLEEVRRYQKQIMGALGISTKTDPKKVDDDLKARVKALGRQVSHTTIDSIFGGQLVSLVVCQSCMVRTHRFEPFLDLSLPVAEDKPTRPRKLCGSAADDDETEYVLTPRNKAASAAGRATSKHVQKKERRAARRGQKHAPPAAVPAAAAAAAGDGPAPDSGLEQDKDSEQDSALEPDKDSERGSAEGQSDADEEDNGDTDLVIDSLLADLLSTPTPGAAGDAVADTAKPAPAPTAQDEAECGAANSGQVAESVSANSGHVAENGPGRPSPAAAGAAEAAAVGERGADRPASPARQEGLSNGGGPDPPCAELSRLDLDGAGAGPGSGPGPPCGEMSRLAVGSSGAVNGAAPVGACGPPPGPLRVDVTDGSAASGRPGEPASVPLFGGACGRSPAAGAQSRENSRDRRRGPGRPGGDGAPAADGAQTAADGTLGGAQTCAACVGPRTDAADCRVCGEGRTGPVGRRAPAADDRPPQGPGPSPDLDSPTTAVNDQTVVIEPDDLSADNLSVIVAGHLSSSDRHLSPSDGRPSPEGHLSPIVYPSSPDCHRASSDGHLSPTDHPSPSDSHPSPSGGHPSPDSQAPPCNGQPPPSNGLPPPSDGQPSPSDGRPSPPDDQLSSADCERAGAAPTRSEWLSRALSTLSARYQAAAGECSVLTCLNQYTAPELLAGNNKFGCDSCTELRNGRRGPDGAGDKESGGGGTVYSNASKQLLVYSPPPVLTVQLKRFEVCSFSLRKVNRHVQFSERLDLAPFCSSICQDLPQMRRGQRRVLYSLFGVVEHSGRLNSGHYTAYVRVRRRHERLTVNADLLTRRVSDAYQLACDRAQAEAEAQAQAQPEPEANQEPEQEPAPEPGRWFHVSDTHVTEVTLDKVLKSQAYMLFYERVV